MDDPLFAGPFAPHSKTVNVTETYRQTILFCIIISIVLKIESISNSLCIPFVFIKKYLSISTLTSFTCFVWLQKKERKIHSRHNLNVNILNFSLELFFFALYRRIKRHHRHIERKWKVEVYHQRHRINLSTQNVCSLTITQVDNLSAE